MPSLLSMYVRVTPARPCPICGHDTWCLVSRKGRTVLCQRTESPTRKGDAGFFHTLDRPVNVPDELKTQAADKLPPDVIESLVMGWMADMTPRLASTLARELGITVRSLNRLNVGWNSRLECFTFPMRNADFEYVGARYRFPDGSKRALKGGSEGLFLPLDSVGFDDLFVTEGPTDCAALLDCGFGAIGRPNNLCGIDDVCELVERFRPRRVVIVDDADEAGAMGGNRLFDRLRELPAWIGVPARIKPAQHKDARETIRAGGRREFILGALGVTDNRYWQRVE